MKPAALTWAISSSLPSLRKSERKVAEFILANLTDVIRMRIVDLAEKAEVSEPTVVRFCRAVGCDGFQDFKLALAQQLASSPSYGQIAVTDQDSVAEYTVKVLWPEGQNESQQTIATFEPVRPGTKAPLVVKGGV